MEAQLKPLVAERGAIKAKLTVFKRFVDALSPETDATGAEKRAKANEGLYDKFDSIQSQIERIVVGTDLEDIHLRERETFEGTFFDLLAIVENETHSATRLPVINLPTFDGKYDDWIRFRDTFSSLVHNNDRLTEIERFHYLTGALKGSAARVIQSLGVSDANYQIAWTSLKERFEDPKVLMHHHANSLLNTPIVEKRNSSALRDFVDSITNHTRALESLLTPAEAWDAIVSLYLSAKLDATTFEEWEKHTMKASGHTTLKYFTSFVEVQARYLEGWDQGRQGSGSNVKTGQGNVRFERQVNFKGKTSAVSHIASTRDSCPLCNKHHLLPYCSKLLSMSTSERQDTVKRLHGCFNCLRSGHGVKNCARGACRKCGKRHHTLLHIEKGDTEEQLPTTSQVESNGPIVQSCVTNSNVPEYTVLSTAIVYVRDHEGNRQACRALLDAGSQANFVTEEFCDRLQLPRSSIEMTVGGLGWAASSVRAKTSMSIQSKCASFNAELPCLIIKNITEEMPNIPLNKARIPFPPGVVIADPDFDKPNRIDLLIGAGLFRKLLCIGQHKAGSGSLIWQKTRLGWVLGGSLCWPLSAPSRISAYHVAANDLLHRVMSRFWEVEDYGNAQSFSVDTRHDESEKHFASTTNRDPSGRFIVSIPFNDKVHELGDSRSQAERRLLNMEKRFSRDEDLFRQYSEFMREYETLGHMTPIDTDREVKNDGSYHLPHHAVFKRASTTTKIRVVFYGSSRTSSGVSLNNTQLVGPTVQSDLVAILLRFRTHRYVLSADIKKMYRQVTMRKCDRRFQRILRRYSSNEPIKTYELNTVTYGTAAASFLATRVSRKVGEDCVNSAPTASRTIIEDFYVDDLLMGCDSVSESIELRMSLTIILAQAGFPLRKWASNNPRVLTYGDTDASAPIEIKAADKDPKTLGLLWCATTDKLKYCVRTERTSRVIKRGILSEIAHIFDPLGLVAPVLIKAKILMQELWQLQVGWDESLVQSLHTQWLTFRNELQSLASLAIPRRALHGHPREVELHGFSDASERAYGACLYLRARDSTGAWVAQLLCSKSRVAPLKTVSLPRLELCGALLLARLAVNVKHALRDLISREQFWTDSTITLSWIKGEPTRWKTFVANRVSEIQRITPENSWRHVPTEDNPADLTSRGANPSALKECALWWFGPAWLAREAERWPPAITASQIIPEARTTKAAHLAVSDAKLKDNFDLFSRYSSYSKLLRVTAYCLRFARLARKNRDSSPQTNVVADASAHPPRLTSLEYVSAERSLVKCVQANHFAAEMLALQTGKPLAHNSKLLSLK